MYYINMYWLVSLYVERMSGKNKKNKMQEYKNWENGTKTRSTIENLDSGA